MPAAEAPVRVSKSSKVFAPVEKIDRGEDGKQGEGAGRKKGGKSDKETTLATETGGQSRRRSPQQHVVVTVERSIRTVEVTPPERRERPRGLRQPPQPRRVVEIPFVERGLKKGTLFKARLRVNAQNTAEAYCCIPPLPVDVTIAGRPEDYFAVHGDEVVVSLIPRLIPRARGAWADPRMADMTTGARREAGAEEAGEASGEILAASGEVAAASEEVLAASGDTAMASDDIATAIGSTATASDDIATAISSTATALDAISIVCEELPTEPEVCRLAKPQVDAMTPLQLPSSTSLEDIAALLRAHPEHRVQGRIVGVARASPLRGSA
ncbi:hypothetical protein H632_c1845p0, partial [Helicosporidium sp. ATCC 50920]